MVIPDQNRVRSISRSISRAYEAKQEGVHLKPLRLKIFEFLNILVLLTDHDGKLSGMPFSLNNSACVRACSLVFVRALVMYGSKYHNLRVNLGYLEAATSCHVNR
jgi:hypothetical protein